MPVSAVEYAILDAQCLKLAVSSPNRARATPTLEWKSRGVIASAALQDPRGSRCSVHERNQSQSLRAHALHTRHFNRLILKMNQSDPSSGQRTIYVPRYSLA